MDSITLSEAIQSRRSVYALSSVLSPESPVTDARIQEIVEEVILHAPSPFNAQSCRVLILLRNEHCKFWDLAAEAFKESAGERAFASLAGKIEGLRNAYGSVLFFEDPEAFKSCEATLGPRRWELVKDRAPEWSEHSNAMQQYALWLSFVAEGFGCNLQHYNPIVDSRVQKAWNIPETWNLRAQLVFGKPTGPPNEKTTNPLEDRVLLRAS